LRSACRRLFPEIPDCAFSTPQNWTLANYQQMLDPYYARVIWNTVTLAANRRLHHSHPRLPDRLSLDAAERLRRRRRRLSQLPADRVSRIAMAVGLLWTYAFLPLPIYGTAAILVIAFVVRFIGYAARLASTSFQQIDPSLEEAGRSAA